MTIKRRLVLAFCLIIIIPIVLASAGLFGYYQLQTHSLKQDYGIESDEASFLFANSIQLMSRYAEKEYQEIAGQAKTDPDLLLTPEYLEEKNESLKSKWSFLLCSSGGTLLYNGDESVAVSGQEWLSSLPAYGDAPANKNTSYYYVGDEQSLVRQVDFVTSGNITASIYIITSSNSIQPQVKQTFVMLIIMMILILALTAGLMTLWVYGGITNPLKKLQTAMRNIQDGNLDFKIDYTGNDEIGDLCKSFEEMRVRLKESTEEKILAEKESKDLISNIAHDLKTPITALKGYAEGILDGVAKTEDMKNRYVQTIYNKANEMDHLINELTIYAKIDSNKIPYNFNKIDLRACFEDCIAEIGFDLETNGIELTYEDTLDERVTVIADPEQLMRVIHNIINNSVKYMEPGRPGKIDVRIRDVGDFVQVEIADNGKGISLKDLPYIFDRFYRTDSSRNSSTGGSGIGLSIVKKIIEDHGGKIWATSKEHIGTTMYFVLRKYQEEIR